MADLDKAATEPLLNSPIHTWYTQDDYRDVQARLARGTLLPSDHTAHPPFGLHMCRQDRSHQASVRVQAQSECDFESIDSESMPALTRGNSIASRRSSGSSYCRSVVDGGCVMETDGEVLTVPTRFRRDANLPCPFEILDCDEIFSDIVEFKGHVFSHFRGQPLPPFAPCFVCGHIYLERPEDDSARAWNDVLSHMVYQHYRAGGVSVRIKPNIALMRYMWNKRIITDAEFKRTQLVTADIRPPGQNHELGLVGQAPQVPMAPSAPVPSGVHQLPHRSVGMSTEPYTMSAGRRQDRRQSNQRLMARIRNVS